MLTNRIQLVAPWVYGTIGDKCGQATAAIGYVVSGKMAWGAVFEGYTGASIVVHFACEAPRLFTRGAIRACFQYPFEQLGVSKIIAPTISGNIKAVKLIEGVGFHKEATIEGAYPSGKDCIYYTITKDQCRWL